MGARGRARSPSIEENLKRQNSLFFQKQKKRHQNNSSHTYERTDGKEGWFHTVWSASNSADSITTSGYTT